jgi:hypothetical protein
MQTLIFFLNNKVITVCVFTICFITLLKVTLSELNEYGIIDKKIPALPR